MRKWCRRAIRGGAVLLALLMAGMPLFGAYSHVLALAEPVKIRVEITDSGFFGSPDEFDIEVEQGQQVEITFVWNQQVYPQDEHIMVLEGYKLETDKINSENREGSFKFVADKVGKFNFKCDIECDNHDYLQKGYLKVKAAGGGSSGASSGRVPTSLAVSSSKSILTSAGGPLVLTAVLKDASGAPVPKAEVRFYAEAELAGTKGQMEIGVGKTDANGVATLEYQSHVVAPKLKITARFEAMGLYDESQQIVEIEQLGEPPPAYAKAPTGLEDAPTIGLGSGGDRNVASSAWDWSVNHWGPVAIATVVLGVWSTLGFALYQVYGISRQRSGGEGEETGAEETASI